MNARRGSASFGRSLAVAILLSFGGAAVLAGLSPFVAPDTALRAVIALLGCAYVLYLLCASGERVGRMTTVVGWLGLAATAGLAGLPLPAYALAHVGLVWLVRSLYYRTGGLPALADLGVAALGAAFAVWAAQRSGSAWLAFWCFFLVQAFHVLIPATLATRPAHADLDDDAFARAQRAAEAAVRRLSTAR